MAIRVLLGKEHLDSFPTDVKYEIEERRVPSGFDGWKFVTFMRGRVLKVEDREDGKHVLVWTPDGRAQTIRYADNDFSRTPVCNVAVDATPAVREAYERSLEV